MERGWSAVPPGDVNAFESKLASYSKPGSEHIDRIREAAGGIMVGLARGENVGERIASLNAITGHEDYDLDHFESLPSHTSVDEFAREAALPPPRVIPNLTRNELN
jgi:hypothetical protein